MRKYLFTLIRFQRSLCAV